MGAGETAHILLVADKSDAELVRQAFTTKSETQWARLTVVNTLHAARMFLTQTTPDLAITAYQCPDGKGVELLDQQYDMDRFPVVLITDHDDEGISANITYASVVDYIAKSTSPLSDISRIAKRALRTWNLELKQKRGHTLSRTQAQEYAQQIIDTIPEGVIVLDSEGRVVHANRLGKQDLANLALTQVGKPLTHIGSLRIEQLLAPPEKGRWHTVEAHNHHYHVSARPLKSSTEPGNWVLVVRDVTQQLESQQRIYQQERLAAVGQLAAGIAHDFNNIMATIVLYSQIISQSPDITGLNQDRLITIHQQAKHAANLIQQILDFSRRSVVERKPLDLIPLLKEQVKMLQRTLPENIKINLACGPETLTGHRYIVNGDPTRIQQMLTNLALNARDAMPEGGDLFIGLGSVHISNAIYAPIQDMDLGEWIQITISDTGTGMPQNVLDRIYEPFFTTKPHGQGNGLGLSQVYGIVKQHDGEIDVKSKINEGTIFTIYLPAISYPETQESESQPYDEHFVEGHGEGILLVEDDTATREALVDSLELLNYHVLSAHNGGEALEILEQHANDIQLVVTDVIMPDMGGVALLRALRAQGMEMRVMMLTGHAMQEKLEDMLEHGLDGWVTKPISLTQLAEKVAEILRKS